MSKARDLANLLGGGTSGAITFGGTAAIRVPNGTTEQRPTPAAGMIRYNTTTGFAEVYDGNIWVEFGAPPPSISTVTPSTYNGESGTTFTINGANFTSDATVYFITSNGAQVQAGSVTFANSSQIQATTPQDFTVADEPLDVKVVQVSGAVTKLDTIDCGGIPTWNTESGTLLTVDDQYGSYSPIVTVSASDPDAGSTIAYSVVSGSLPAGTSLSSSAGTIGGDPTNVGSQTTSNFTLAATDNAGNSTQRAFSIIVRPAVDGSTSVKASGSPAQIASLLGTPTNGVYWYKNPGYNSNNPFQAYTDWSVNSNTGYMILTQSQISGSVITNFTDVGTLSTSVSGTRGHNNTFREPTANILTGWSGDTSNRCIVGMYRTSTGSSLATASYLNWIQIAVTPAVFKNMFDDVPTVGQFIGVISARSAGGTGTFYWSKTSGEYPPHLQMGNTQDNGTWNANNYMEIKASGGDPNHGFFVTGDGLGTYWTASNSHYNGGSQDRVGFFGFAPNNFI